jgi:hypothetical protein
MNFGVKGVVKQNQQRVPLIFLKQKMNFGVKGVADEKSVNK